MLEFFELEIRVEMTTIIFRSCWLFPSVTCTRCLPNPFSRKQPPSLLLWVRDQQAHTSTTIIPNQLILYKSELTRKDQHSRPLIVLMPWLEANPKQAGKYAKIYLDKGLDVLTAYTSLRNAMFPKNGVQVLTKSIISYLTENSENQKFVVQSLSIGAYLFGEMLVHLGRDPQLRERFMQKLLGMIFDSPAGCNYGARGAALAVSQNPLVITMVQSIVSALFRITYNSSTKHHKKALDLLAVTTLSCPISIMISDQDLIDGGETGTSWAKVMAASGMDVRVKKWSNRGHCNLILNYPEEYSQDIYDFLEEVELRHNVERKSYRGSEALGFMESDKIGILG